MPDSKMQIETFLKLKGAFGSDVSTVATHVDKVVKDRTAKLSAAEYALCNRIFFHSQSPQLLGHELTHAIQQGSGKTLPGAELEAKSLENLDTKTLVKRVVQEMKQP